MAFLMKTPQKKNHQFFITRSLGLVLEVRVIKETDQFTDETLDDEKPEKEEVIDKENEEGSEKLNRSSVVSANTPSKICHTFPGNGRCQRLSFKPKAAGSVEGNVLDKESARISDKIVVGIHHVGILCENLERSFQRCCEFKFKRRRM
ncbi:hypothetical protein ES288_A08G063700v1 [Gossypium darwinii]|uniref:Uncharacterized protein n=1 Tax=Gossypium darwinii TaxID=34276 RepID=A0A5D2FKW5_GOSDA|nr:hypothetical protein ES288_A08G063700v1 [Gossypium darwinii]